MALEFNLTEDKLTVFLSGEIDHHSAKGMREQIDQKILSARPKTLELNFKNVTFMDSSGIGLIMGRHRLCSEYGASVEVSEVSSYLYRVMRLAGLDSIVNVKAKTLKEEKK